MILSRGRHTETVAIPDLGPEEAAPVLKQYVTEIPITRPFFDAKPDAPLEAIVAEAHRHPVFRIYGASASSIGAPPFSVSANQLHGFGRVKALGPFW
jgi:hypothetical protein